MKRWYLLLVVALAGCAEPQRSVVERGSGVLLWQACQNSVDYCAGYIEAVSLASLGGRCGEMTSAGKAALLVRVRAQPMPDITASAADVLWSQPGDCRR